MRLSTWDQVTTTAETNSSVRELACEHLRRILTEQRQDSYTAKVKCEVYSAIWREDYAFLVQLELDYALLQAEDAYHLRQALAFYRKRSDLDLGIDREEVAYGKFVQTEAQCSETNTIFRKWVSGGFLFPSDVEAIFHRAQRKISHLLGDVPKLDTLRLRFGPGATTQIQKRNASARRKLSQTYACSEDLIPLASQLLEEMPAWVPFSEDSDSALVTVEIHDGKLAFVPKDAKTDRSIVVEPMLNSMLQLGIGDYIGSRLRRFGIDIRDQARNQNLARLGSLHGGLATLDLSSASDTIAVELVAHLLPLDWFFFLQRARTGTVEYKGTKLKLQKFSSMGNGFTFPLETLIFWALAVACTDDERAGDVSVYGDDIIVPTDVYPILHKVLCAAGFSLNERKSFATGPFRESCGKDYFAGIDIRPVYLKDRLSGSSCFVLHNYYVRRMEFELAAIVRSWLDPELHIWGPDGYGDGHLLGEYRRVPHRNTGLRNGGWCGYTFETFTWRGRKDFRPLPGDYVYPSYSCYIRGIPDAPTLPDSYFRDKRVGRLATGDDYVERCIEDLRVLGTFSAHDHRPDGTFGVSLPGVKGYKRIKIYTLG